MPSELHNWTISQIQLITMEEDEINTLIKIDGTSINESELERIRKWKMEKENKKKNTTLD